MNKLLGICIPTYKRPDQLKLCIESIIQAARPFDVPIFIADDSVDTTNHAVLNHLARDYPHLFITANDENLGIA